MKFWFISYVPLAFYRPVKVPSSSHHRHPQMRMAFPFDVCVPSLRKWIENDVAPMNRHPIPLQSTEVVGDSCQFTFPHGTSDLITNGAYIHTHITHIRNIKRGRGTGGNRGQAKKGVGLLSMTLEFWILILLSRGHAGSAFKDILSKKDLYSKWGFIFVTFPRSWKLFRLLYIRQNDYSFFTSSSAPLWMVQLYGYFPSKFSAIPRDCNAKFHLLAGPPWRRHQDSARLPWSCSPRQRSG